MAGLRSIAGGEIKEYTQLCEQARSEALAKMIEMARGMSANAIISMNFDSADLAVTENTAAEEIIAYGTAVVAEPVAGETPPPPEFAPRTS